MNVALFSGTFDPIHCGHLAVARAARDRFALERVYLVPTARPPHRGRRTLSAYEHRYAMVALACAHEAGLVPSLAEAPSRRGTHYSVRTVQRFRRERGPGQRLFFIIGADAFLEFRTWYRWRRLLQSAEFIIVSRPGFALERAEGLIPAELLSERVAPAAGDSVAQLRLRNNSAWIMTGVAVPVSGTEIRKRAGAGQSLAGLVTSAVAEYIATQGLYKPLSQVSGLKSQVGGET